MYCTTFPSHSPQYSVDPTFQRCKTLSCDFLKHVRKRLLGISQKRIITILLIFEKSKSMLMCSWQQLMNSRGYVREPFFVFYSANIYSLLVGIRKSGCFGGQVATRGLTDIPVD